MRHIKKAKITGVGYMEITHIEEKEIGEEKSIRLIKHKDSYEWDPHPDLKDAFAKLRFHLAWLCKQVDQATLRVSIEDERFAEELNELVVTGYVIGGSYEHEGVTLIGRRALANNRVLNLISPFCKWEDENNPYDYSFQMQQDISKCEEEVKLFMEGKCAPIVIHTEAIQTTIDFDVHPEMSDAAFDPDEYLDEPDEEKKKDGSITDRKPFIGSAKKVFETDHTKAYLLPREPKE